MRRAFSALERKDVDACVKLMPSDFTINIAGMPYQKRGTEAWRKHAEILFSAFPDIQIHIEDIFASDDKVAVRMRVTGTHTGAFIGIQPTGKKVSYEINELYRIADGKIAEEWICSDMLTLMAPIGGDWAFDGQACVHVVCWLSGMGRAFSWHRHRGALDGTAARYVPLRLSTLLTRRVQAPTLPPNVGPLRKE